MPVKNNAKDKISGKNKNAGYGDGSWVRESINIQNPYGGSFRFIKKYVRKVNSGKIFDVSYSILSDGMLQYN